MSYIFLKDPDAVLDYAVDWSQWLQASETISTSEWLLPTDLTKESDSHTDTTATVWLSGGTLGARDQVTNRITTSQGRTNDRTLTVWLQNL